MKTRTDLFEDVRVPDPVVGKKSGLRLQPFDQLLPARPDELGRCLGGHLAAIVAVHVAQHLDSIEHILGGARPAA